MLFRKYLLDCYNKHRINDEPGSKRLNRELLPQYSPGESINYDETPTKHYSQTHKVAKFYGLVPANKKTSISSNSLSSSTARP